MFDYDVMTKEEANRARYSLLDDGDYKGKIKNAVDRISSTGNKMFEVDIEVYDKDGCTHIVKDFLTFTPKMMWKVIHCAESTNTFDQYNTKKFTPASLKDKSCHVLVKRKEGNFIPEDKLNGKPAGSKYPDKNIIEDYICDLEHRPSKLMPLAQKNDFINDAIPF